MSDEIVTAESDPGLYASLVAVRAAEKNPGWVMTNKRMYKVIQNADTKAIEFHYIPNRDYYDSTGI